MRKVLALTVIVAASSSGASAKDDNIKFGPAATWAQVSEPFSVPENARGPIFLRRQDAQIHLDQTGQQTFFATLIRLMEPSALQLGNVTLSWNPAAGSPVVHAVRIHRNGAVRDVLAATQFETLRRENQLETAVLDGTLTAVLRVPDIRVGDELELSYTTHSHDPTFDTENAGMLHLGASPPPGRYNLRLSWTKDHAPNLKQSADFDARVKREAQAVTVAIDNPEVLNPPKDAPPRYAWQRVVEYSDFADWQSVSRRMSALFGKASSLSDNSPIRREAAEIAAAYGDETARAAAALKLVQQQVRYVYVGLNGGNLTPATAEETWERRYGDCKGKTALLLALLKELGIPAEAVLVNNSGFDDGLNQRLPTPFAFDHILVRAQIAGKPVWLDGTLPHTYRPTAQPVFPYRWVLPLTPSGAALEPMPWAPAAEPDELTLYEIDARAGFTAPAKRRQVSIKRRTAALGEYMQFSAISDSQLENAFRQELEGSTQWNTIEKVSWRFDGPEQASVLEIIGTGPVDWDNDGGNRRSLSLPGGGFSPPERRQRGSDAGSAAPFYAKPEFDCRVTTIRLPSTTVDKDWSFNTTFDQVLFGQTFRRSFERREGTIRMIRANSTLQPEITPSVAEADNIKLTKFDNSMAWVYYDPGSFDRPRSAQSVPATYERDWVQDPSACLSTVAAAK